MNFYKYTSLLVFISLFAMSSCNKDDSDEQKTFITLEITHFEGSKNQVDLEWKLEKSDDIIIRKLQIFRTVVNGDPRERLKEIVWLPSNETSFTDDDIPFEKNIEYFLRATYYEDKELEAGAFPEYKILETPLQSFIRELVSFEEVPLQVRQDPTDDNVFYILDKSGTGQLLKYNNQTNETTGLDIFDSSSYMHNVFHIEDHSLYVGNTKGNLYEIHLTDFQIAATYQLEIEEKLRSFSIDEHRIYFTDDDLLKFFDTNSRTTQNTFWAYFPGVYMETLNPGNTLFLSKAGYHNIVEISKQNCVESLNCWPEIVKESENYDNRNSHVDPFIFAWNNDKTKFISSYYGDVFSMSDLKKEVSLKSITGKNYFQFAFDSEGNIYATVQSEKLIHVFNENYDLINTIETKLYPLFPMISESNFSCIGRSKPVSYWGYYYGYEFNFDLEECLIETF